MDWLMVLSAGKDIHTNHLIQNLVEKLCICVRLMIVSMMMMMMNEGKKIKIKKRVRRNENKSQITKQKKVLYLTEIIPYTNIHFCSIANHLRNTCVDRPPVSCD